MTPRYVLTGLATENSLRPLAAALRHRGLPTAFVDLADADADRSCLPAGTGPVVLISSQHLAMTGAVYDSHSSISSRYLAPQTLKRQIGADLLVYVPHDLAEPVLPSEVDVLGTVDLYAAPDHDSWWARAHVPTVVTGWVGTAWDDAERLAKAPLDHGVLFLTQVRWLLEQGGAPFVLDALSATLASGVAVKLPLWPGVAPLADALRGEGVPLVEPDLAAAVVARSTPLVVTNGPSSVLAEAMDAGHRPVCVLPPEGDQVFAGQLGSLDVAVCRDGGFAQAAASAGRVRPPAEPFDVDLLLDAVARALGGR